MNPDAFKELKRIMKQQSDYVLTLRVIEKEDFFGKAFDTTGIDIYKPGYWISAGLYGQYGWVGFIRPNNKSTGLFSMHRIRIHTHGRLNGINY